MKLKIIFYLICDYIYAFHKQVGVFIFTKPPAYYLSRAVEGKSPIILIPGVYEKWYFLKSIADRLSGIGHPIYILDGLGYNTKEISSSARLVYDFMKEKNLKDVVIIAHSKGGLIGKYVLSFYNKRAEVKKLIAIATPFGGSNIVKFIPFKILNLSPSSDVIKILRERNDINNKIVSIFGVFDNSIWPLESCCLEGAKNVQANVYGHHRILSNKKTLEIIVSEIERL